LAEGCGRLGTKEEQIEYGSLCAVLWSSDAKGYHMIGKHQGCGNDGWNGAGRKTAGAFCAECPDCPGSNFRALPKRSCHEETKSLQWYSYDSRAAAEEACLAEGCGRLGTKEEQIEYGSLCAVLWSSDAKGYHMIGKHQGCGNDGWNGAGRKTAGAFCAECHDCPASEEESGTAEEESATTEEESGPQCTTGNRYNSNQVSVKGCNAQIMAEGVTFCLNGKTFTVGSSWNSAGGATVNLASGESTAAGFFQEGDAITIGACADSGDGDSGNGDSGTAESGDSGSAEGGDSGSAEGGVQATADCPAVCINCKQGWGSASADLVNGICTKKCSDDFGNCVKVNWKNGVDCTGCTELAQSVAPPAPIEASAEGDGGEDDDHDHHEDHDHDHSTIPHKGRTPLAKSSYRIAVTLPLSLQSMTAEAKKELKTGAEEAFHCGTDVNCAAELQEGPGVSLIESRKSFTIIIVVVVLGVPDEVAALPDLATELDSLKSHILAGLIQAAKDPALHAALLVGTVDDVTPEAGHSWIQGTNAENAPFSCLRVDGQGYADHLYADHSGGDGDVWYGDLSEAKKRCVADDECVVLHDWAGDGIAWRACRSVTFNAGGPAHTMMRS